MTQTDYIKAQVNTRLITKANRLFTGTLKGRIIEILQNARRAGATEVQIQNQNGFVSVQDNGAGIRDFRKLLDLGGSGWDNEPSHASFEDSEDPAGVGLFCLAPRKVTIQSRGKTAVVEGDGWTGAAVHVHEDTDSETNQARGATLRFEDEPWTKQVVEPLAVFTGLQVVVDGLPCESEPFITRVDAHDRELGCRLQIIPRDQLSKWQRDAARIGCFGEENVIVNFYGQTLGFTYRPIDERSLYYFIDLTGEPTGIRLMLPARTQLVENEAFEELKALVEREAYRYIQRRGRHKLPYAEYQRAQELGIALPESDPVYTTGLLGEDGYGLFPVEVQKPDDLDLSCCYRMSSETDDDESSGSANAHLLGAFHRGDAPFVPVTIHSRYDGYRWADLPRIIEVNAIAGHDRYTDEVWTTTFTCVESLRIEVKTNDGRCFKHDVPLAIRPSETDLNGVVRHDMEVLVTPDARQMQDEDIWYHAGGFFDEGDTWDTQLERFGEELSHFWAQLDGPDEALRRRVMKAVETMSLRWESMTIHHNGTVEIRHQDGSTQTLTPPAQPVSGEGGAA
jgi:hypothetical protein